MRAVSVALFVLLSLLVAAPAVANDASGTTVHAQERPFVAPPGTERFRPRWKPHLTAEQVYRRGRTERDVGLGLTVTGTTLGVMGAFLGLAALASMGRPCADEQGACYTPIVYGAFATFAGLGAVPFLATGIPLWQRGYLRMIQAQPYLKTEPRARAARGQAGVVISGRF